MPDENVNGLEDTLDVFGSIDILAGVEGSEPLDSPPVVPEPVPGEQIPTAEIPSIVELPDSVKHTLSKYGDDKAKLAQGYNELYGKFQEGQAELNKARPTMEAIQSDVELQRKVFDHLTGRAQPPAPVEQAPKIPAGQVVVPASFMPEGVAYDPYEASSDPNSFSAKANEAYLDHRDAQRAQAQEAKYRAQTAAQQYQQGKQAILASGVTPAQFTEFERWAASPKSVTLDNLHKLYRLKDTLQKVELDTRTSVIDGIKRNAAANPSVATAPAGAEPPEPTDEEAFARDLKRSVTGVDLASLLR